MEREVGRGIGMENTCKPMADSFQCMTKSTTIKKERFKKEASRCVTSRVLLLYLKELLVCGQNLNVK